jgi:TonB family protein
MLMMLAEPPAVVQPAPVWLREPTQTDLARAVALYQPTGGGQRETMTCYVRADGDLEACSGGWVLPHLAALWKVDRSRYHLATVQISVTFPDEIDTPVKLLQKPTLAQVAAAAPGGRYEGAVDLLCAVDVHGAAHDCEPQATPTPINPEVLAAAQSIVPLHRFSPAKKRKVPTPSWAVVSIDFASPILKRPDWISKPSGAQLSNAYPRTAAASGVPGSAIILCQVRLDGAVENCKVAAETPLGAGFGEAALKLAPLFRISPLLKDGTAVAGAEVTIPIAFAWPEQEARSRIAITGPTYNVLEWSPFTAAPSKNALSPAGVPTPATVHFICAISSEGGLRDCEDVSPSPPGGKAVAAARALLPSFRVNTDLIPREERSRLRAPVVLRLGPPGPKPPLFLRTVDWLRGISSEDVLSAFPPKAVEAKVLSGLGVVDCRVGEDGALLDCTVVNESPAELGFGEAARKVASILRANIWSRLGEPTAGATLRLPLRFIYSED